MASRMVRTWVLLGSVGAVSLAVGYLALTKRIGPPKRFTIRVSGAEGTPLSATVEVDGVAQDSVAEVPAEFAVTGRALSFTVRRVGSPDRPVCVAVDVDGVMLGTGTAGDGIRGSFADGPAEAKRLFLWAVEPADEPEQRSRPAPRDASEQAEQSDQTPRGPPPDLIGTRPPEWELTEWLNTDSMSRDQSSHHAPRDAARHAEHDGARHAERDGYTPLRLADLRGKVVLVRWFTGPN